MGPVTICKCLQMEATPKNNVSEGMTVDMRERVCVCARERVGGGEACACLHVELTAKYSLVCAVSNTSSHQSKIHPQLP
jgi:hypothetical protein